MGSGVSDQSPKSIKTLLRNIASNKELCQDYLDITKAALGGPTVLNPYLYFGDLYSHRNEIQQDIISRSFRNLAKGYPHYRPRFDQIGQLATVSKFSNTFRWFYTRKNGLVNLELLDALKNLKDPLVSGAANDILNLAVYSNLDTFGVELARLLIKKSNQKAQPTARSPEEGSQTPCSPKVKCSQTPSSPKVKSQPTARSPEEYIVFHHYTSPDCIKAIKESGMIIQSTANGSTVYGCGVYGTPLCPENGREKIAKNNYADGWRLKEKDGKVEAVFRIKLNKKNQRVKQIVDPPRKIYLYDGDLKFADAEEVDLIYYTGKIRRVENLKVVPKSEGTFANLG